MTTKRLHNSAVQTILVVDDSLDNLELLTDYLSMSGLNVITAPDGKTALALAAKVNFNVILLDVMMPGMDGFETCRRLKKIEGVQHVPVIFMTALSDTASKVRGFQAGAVDYVTKPFHYEEVLARITTHLRLRELTERLEQMVAERTEELDRAYRQLARLDKAKTDFIHITSHEIRTPVSLLDGYTRLLVAHLDSSKGEEANTIVDGILGANQRLIEVMNHILDATQIDTEGLVLVKQEVSLLSIVLAVREHFSAVLAERNLNLTLEANMSHLPPIEADAILLDKVFYHLIVNAIKYTPNGGCITVRGRRLVGRDAGAIIEIVVEDSGIGIDPADLELIFEKFYQTGQATLHSSGKTSFKGGGPGLGLAIARGIVQAHGGQIWAESEGHDEENYPGSRFYVRLPVSST